VIIAFSFLSNTDGLAVKPMDVAVYAKQVVRVARAFDLGETPVALAVGGGPVAAVFGAN
jgi:hypothetical protein